MTGLTTSHSSFAIWLLLLAGPLLFLLGIVGVSVFFGMRGIPAADVPARVTALAPHILLGVLVCLALLLARFPAPVRAAWSLPDPGKAGMDIAVGVMAGVVLAVAYLWFLAPGLEKAQRVFGDFVPPGSVLPTISGSLVVFFLANVVFAPLVEETLYRGVALPQLSGFLGTWGAVAVTCLFFGLLHWPGGMWYMLLTGVVAGGAFAGLYGWRGGVLAPFVAHLTLNAIEFAYAWRTHAQV